MKTHQCVLALLACGLLSGCVLFTPVPDYTLSEAGGIVGTNSSILFPDEDKTPYMKREEGRVHLRYPLLLRNTGAEGIGYVYLSQAEFRVNGLSLPIQCRAIASRLANPALKPGEKARVQCDIDLKPDDKNKLALRDSRGTIRLPIHTKTRSAIEFAVVLRIEDFQ